MIISIGGQSGSGKNEVAKVLANKLGIKFYSVGNFRRDMAVERNINLTRLNDVGEKQDFTDKKADEFVKKLGNDEDNFVIAGRLAHYFIPNSVKILLKAHLRIRAERAYTEEREMEGYRDLGDAIASLINREKSDRYRFKKYYGIELDNEMEYDLIISTDNLTYEEVAEQIIDFLKKEGILKEVV
jgi:cytidylate kinase